MNVRTSYRGPIGTAGSKITVKGPHGQRTYPYDHGAYDPHVTAAERYATDLGGMSGASGERVKYTRSRRGYVIEVDYR